MEGDERRQFILKLLAGSESPLSGTVLVKACRIVYTGGLTLTAQEDLYGRLVFYRRRGHWLYADVRRRAPRPDHAALFPAVGKGTPPQQSGL